VHEIANFIDFDIQNVVVPQTAAASSSSQVTTTSSTTAAGNFSFSVTQDELQRLVQGFVPGGTFPDCNFNFNVNLPGSSFQQNL